MTADNTHRRASLPRQISQRTLGRVQRALLGGIVSLSVAMLDRRLRKALQR
jgi:hypothetical protein